MNADEALVKLRACAEAGLTLAGRDWREAEEAEAIIRRALSPTELAKGWLYYGCDIFDPPLLHSFGCRCSEHCYPMFSESYPSKATPDAPYVRSVVVVEADTG